MNKKKRKKISALILLLVITIGYALLSTTLKINGIANIKSNTWDIHFENVVANTESTVTAETPSITDNATKVSYEVELSLPGDFYEFTVDVVNNGSINGEITKIDHKVYLSTDLENPVTLPEYIKYSIVYDGTTTAPALGDILNAGESKTYRVRIEFDPEATTLPSTDVTYVVVDEIKYTQTKSSGRELGKCEAKMNQILDNPNQYRNPEQSSENLDIALDDDCNVINLDWWVDEDQCAGTKDYELDSINNEFTLGLAHCLDNGLIPIYTAATSYISNGEIIAPIPAYIKPEEEDHFYPVTEIAYVFGNTCHAVEDYITELPDIPNTVTKIGEGTFHSGKLNSITIPNHIKEIGINAFRENNITYLSFESGSQLEKIETMAFYENNITGDLVLPKSVTYIGYATFDSNNLTSVTFPSSAEYYSSSFDSGVTINHQY